MEVEPTLIRKRVHVIACGVLALDLREVASRVGVEVSMEFLPGGLHNTPQELRRRLQETIDRASRENRADLLAIGYGACGMGSVGIHARQIPLAIPRVNDCIALFLGSDAAYQEQFARYPGTYYISAGWVEERTPPPCATGECPGKTPRAPTDFEQLVVKYGAENAQAIQYFLNSWQRNYQRAAFIDTGLAGRRDRYAKIARAMADEFGWKYEELAGTGALLVRLLAASRSSPEILVVPPHHVTAFEVVSKTLTAVPVWESENPRSGEMTRLVFDEPPAAEAKNGSEVRLGLGIDAGGTYTDVVLYDFAQNEVLQKAKALTTKWDYTRGIDQALDQLDPERLVQSDLVALSTTLATNAIVEGRGQKVGLLVMPPYGLFDRGDIPYEPTVVIAGRLEIDGRELSPVDPDEVRRVARDLVRRERVGAFAVAGFASHVNPDHELAVKKILREETGLSVTCGHEVSAGVNYRVRATTAALNARIIPCLESLIEGVRISLERRCLRAPIMGVRSDGSLMSLAVARERPIETLLSGPAASVAGARYLAGLRDALVVDIGGTTTDTALISDGVVRTCREGASVGGWRTHVQALALRTTGLGGDSLIAWQRGQLRIGPLRVAPVSWLSDRQPDSHAALSWLERNIDSFRTTSRAMDLVMRNGHTDHTGLDEEEGDILGALAEQPLSLHELAHRLGRSSWNVLSLSRLEEQHRIQRCALTPTDLLHVDGRVRLWDERAARRLAELYAHLLGVPVKEFIERVMREFVEILAVELLKKQLDEESDPETLDRSPAAGALVRNLLRGGNDRYRVRVQLHHPLVGIGAPVHFFLPAAARLLETEAIIPPHADVANAIGAITSSVRVHQQVEIAPNESGRYAIEGLPHAPSFTEFEQAHEHAVAELRRSIRERARLAGTSERRVEILVRDRIAPLADGSRLFLGRVLEARLTGRPDLARLGARAQGPRLSRGSLGESHSVRPAASVEDPQS